MEHLFSSIAHIERAKLVPNKGQARMQWVQVDEPFACRLDLNFLRQGKDVPAAVEAGRAPDRIGVLFCAIDVPIRAGDRIVSAGPNEDPDLDEGPVRGTFELKNNSDTALDYSEGHHLEVQIVESNQTLEGQYPVNSGVKP